jgi:hypothetical protein
MYWIDYTIEQQGTSFTIKGDWDGEVIGEQKDGSPKDTYLYKPGDIFVVNEQGWLMKVGDKSDGYSSSN